MTEDIVKFEARSPGVPAPTTDIVMMAIQNKLDPALIEKMMDLSERNEANLARKDYVAAMAKFKANPPEITKDKTVSFGQGKTSYTHASLANVTNKINSALSKYGLSASWNTAQTENLVTVTCTITHENGHSEHTSLTAAPDTSGSKNAIQAIGSTISYLERYTLLALTGLATHDMDDDGNTSNGAPEIITEAQVKEIEGLLKIIYGEDASLFFSFLEGKYGVDTVAAISAKNYKSILGGLKAALKKAREPGSDDK